MNRLVTASIVCLALPALGGCGEKKRTEIMVGLATDLAAPAPLNLVHIDVQRLPEGMPIGDGETNFPISGTPSTVYELPGTYGIYSSNGTADRVQVHLEAEDAQSGVLVIRTAIFSLVPERTLFVRLGVISACESLGDCGGTDLTCVEGRCVSNEIDSSGLPDYRPGIEREIACNGGTTFIDTNTGQPLPMTAFGCATGVCREGLCVAAPTPDGGAGGAGGSGSGGAGGAGGAPPPSRPATLAASYQLENSFAADQPGAPALVPVDPLALSLFQNDLSLAPPRAVWAFSGAASPATSQAGLTLDPGSLVSPESYSIDMVVKLTDRDKTWRRLIDVQNRQSDDGFYVDPSNNLDIYPVAGSTAAFTNGTFHHIVLTVDGSSTPSTARSYLDGVPQFLSSTPEMNLDFDPTNNPTQIISFFLDNVAAGGQGEWSGGEVALIRLWDGVLTADQARMLALNPFGSPP